ncbi:hypothetical protein [Sphingomonas sp. R86521]
MHDLVAALSEALIEGMGDVMPETRKWFWIWLAVLAVAVAGIVIFL